jgi:hypothetical protein
MRHDRAFLATLPLLLALFASACAFGPPKRVATPAELDQLGTKTYPGYTTDEVRQAALTALKVQGYDVVTTDPRIRTSPKLVHVSSSASYSQTSGSARTFGESVAWDIDVADGEAGPKLHATPRASVNGMAMEQMYYDYAERTFRELMKEIDGSLPAKAAGETR